MNSLIERRSAALKESEAIAKRVQAEARPFTDDETRKIAENFKLADDLEATVKESRKIAEALAPAPAAAPTLADGGAMKNFRILRTQDGRECRAFGKGQSMADAMPKSGGLDLDGFGRALAATITGNRRGVESECRALSEGLNSGGSYFVAEELFSQIIDLARNKSRCFEAGAVTLDMPTSDVRLVTIEEDPTIALVGENSLISSDDPVFGSRLLAAKKHGVIVKCSNELLADGLGVGNVITNALASAWAVYLDDLLLDYIFDEAGVGTTASVGQPDWDDVITGMAAIQALNGTPTSILWNPTTAAWYAKLKEATTNAYLAKPEAASTLRILDSNQVASTKMLIADMSKAVVGVRGGLSIELSSQAGDSFAYDQTWIRLLWRGDVGITQKHMHTMTGLTY